MEFVNIPGPSRPLAPQLVVQGHPSGGLVIPPAVVTDSTGAPINPDSWDHAYVYDASGTLLTDTGTDGISTWVKTYSFNSIGQLINQVKWVKQ